MRKQYVAHMAKMLTLSGSSPEKAKKDAAAILAFETDAGEGFDGRDRDARPEKIYHLQPIATVRGDDIAGGTSGSFWMRFIRRSDGDERRDAGLLSCPGEGLSAADMETLKAYMRYQLLTTSRGRLPKKFDAENFDFYGRKLNGQPEQRRAGSGARTR
jgi:putative endopeptidase